jgi:stage II sporulation protein M
MPGARRPWGRLGAYAARRAGAYALGLCLFGVGAGVGAAAARLLPDGPRLALWYTLSAWGARAAHAPPAALWAAAARADVAWAAALWLLGLTVVGIPAVFLALGARGLAVGFALALLVRSAGLGGAVAAAGVAAGAAADLPAALFVAGEATAFAAAALTRLGRRRWDGADRPLAAYAAALAAATAACLLAAAADAAVAAPAVAWALRWTGAAGGSTP